MATSNKVIITCAVTGAIHTPTMSPYLPITPQEIAEAAIGAAEAGAAIVHLHARDPKNGRPDQRPEAFAPFLPIIKQRCNAVINLTSGGAPNMTVADRVKPAEVFKPEVASLNMGSINFALYPMLNRYKEFKYDWEKPYLEGTVDLIFRNTFKDIEFVLRTCQNNDTRFEFECYDIGHLYNLAHFLERGLVQPPLFVQSVFGILGGIGTHPEDVCICAAPPTGCWGERITDGPCWAPAATRCRSPPCRRPWAAMCGWAWRIRYGSAPASSPNPTPSRSARRARSSRGWGWTSRAPT